MQAGGIVLRIYKNALLQAIREAGFDPKDFKPTNDYIRGRLPGSSRDTVMLEHLPALSIAYHGGDDLYFMVRSDGEDAHKFDYAYTKFTPTYPRIPPHPEQFLPGRFVPFDQVLPPFQKWLREHVAQAVEDDSHPDLWAQLSSQTTVATDFASGRVDDSEFTSEERVQIQIALREFRLLVVKTFAPGEEELQVINERLDYLTRAVDRLNRFDWRGVAISTVLGIGTALSLDTEKGRLLWGLFQQAMATVVHLLR